MSKSFSSSRIRSVSFDFRTLGDEALQGDGGEPIVDSDPIIAGATGDGEEWFVGVHR